MKDFEPKAYGIAIRRVVEDGEVLFKGTVKELPDVAVYEANYKKAYEAVLCVIEELYKQALELKKPFPAPSDADEEYSGRVTLRMTRTLHRQVALLAEHEGVSLNHLITTVLATQVHDVLNIRTTLRTSAATEVGYPTHTQAHWVIDRVVDVGKGQFESIGWAEDALTFSLLSSYYTGHKLMREIMRLERPTQPRTPFPLLNLKTATAQ